MSASVPTHAARARRAEVLKALAHPTRVAILEILRPGEECVCRIWPRLGSTQPNTSKHLAILKRAGILETRQEGTMTFYRVRDPRVYELLELVDALAPGRGER